MLNEKSIYKVETSSFAIFFLNIEFFRLIYLIENKLTIAFSAKFPSKLLFIINII